jgi:hypothetical protein
MAFVGLLVLIACGGPAPEFPTYTPSEGNPALLTAEDIEVYEAVIKGYAQAGRMMMSRFHPSVRGSQPISDQELEELSARHPVEMFPYTVASSFQDVSPLDDRWSTLDDRKLPPLLVPHSTIRDFHARALRRASLKGFRPRHLRLDWSETLGTLTVVYGLTLPGYSLARDAAVVEVSSHTYALAGGGELLYLRKIRNRWQVVAKQQTWIS